MYTPKTSFRNHRSTFTTCRKINFLAKNGTLKECKNAPVWNPERAVAKKAQERVERDTPIQPAAVSKTTSPSHIV